MTAQDAYERQVALVMRYGNWLSSPQAQLLSGNDWDEHFQRYLEQLERLREMGDALRPKGLRERHEPLNGDQLRADVAELFAL